MNSEAVLNSSGFRSGLKVVLLALIVVLMLIPFAMIGSLVEERAARFAGVTEEVIAGSGDRQLVSGPVVSVPAIVERFDADGTPIVRRERVEVIAQSLSVIAQIDSSLRRRGIYETPVYEADVSLAGVLTPPRADELPAGVRELLLGEATLLFGVSGLAGVRSTPSVTVDGVPREVRAAAAGKVGYGGSPTRLLEVPLALALAPPEGGAPERDAAVGFRIDLALSGGGSFSVAPAAQTANVTIRSNWATPSFTGSLLPATRTVTDDGFTARWETSALAAGLPAVRLARGSDSDTSAWPTLTGVGGAANLGVELYLPVDHYQRVSRATRYAILFVLLPFVALFLVESLGGSRVHPVQYLFVAAAKALFYLLLLSLSEHAAFALAYWTAAGATAAPLATYFAAITKNARHALVLGTLVAAEYLFLWTALASEEYALLIGCAGLFAVLAAVMLGTRRIDWYAPAGL